MARFYLINTTVLNTAKFIGGDLIDEDVVSKADLEAAGGILFPSGNAVIAGAAAIVRAKRLNNGIDERDADRIMIAAAAIA